MSNKKVALITGAGSGIGRASAIELARNGFAVGLLGRTPSELEEVAELLRRSGAEVERLDADISIEDQMSAAVSRLVERFGRLDAVVANASINGTWAPIEDIKADEWDQTIAVNLRGTYLTLRFAVPHLKNGGGGSIVVVSSINGTRTFTSPGATAYAATKAAQLAMVQQLALELGRHRIRVNAVCPGAIETNIDDSTTKRAEEETAIPVVWPEGQVPLTGGRPGRAEDVAHLITFLVSDASSHITGTPVWIDGGQGLLR
ncbi:Levodione reductase [Pleomorphomonas sp. T1.2MG-36]|uniref:SDR family oxidoreductase n=1 Tax=Pleomorphomonas sp. T1.2MG-36 TaxID=3041167 RepID=UPI0024776256|nr:SDR family NAD(P)-dependent oxidoreductase [Pleomorphomonas sp. T1.2MG-36]CAI9401077.1 Levodione reductase [Pleomorphomonas sp. T1.2MG-36]